MKKRKPGGQKSRLRVDPFTLTRLLCEQNTTLSAVQQAAGIDPAELEPLRTARKVHLDTLNRLAAGLKVPPNSLLITPDSPFTVFHCGQHTQFHIITDNAADNMDEEPDESESFHEENPLYL